MVWCLFLGRCEKWAEQSCFGRCTNIATGTPAGSSINACRTGPSARLPAWQSTVRSRPGELLSRTYRSREEWRQAVTGQRRGAAEIGLHAPCDAEERPHKGPATSGLEGSAVGDVELEDETEVVNSSPISQTSPRTRCEMAKSKKAINLDLRAKRRSLLHNSHVEGFFAGAQL